MVWTPATEKRAFQMAKKNYSPEELSTAAREIGCSEAELRERIANHKHLLEGRSLKNVAKLTLSVFRFGNLVRA